jgi:hypothetical protein
VETFCDGFADDHIPVVVLIQEEEAATASQDSPILSTRIGITVGEEVEGEAAGVDGGGGRRRGGKAFAVVIVAGDGWSVEAAESPEEVRIRDDAAPLLASRCRTDEEDGRGEEQQDELQEIVGDGVPTHAWLCSIGFVIDNRCVCFLPLVFLPFLLKRVFCMRMTLILSVTDYTSKFLNKVS